MAKKKSQSVAQRRRAGRIPKTLWFDEADMRRIELLGDRWGIAWPRDVIREALIIAELRG